MSVSRSPYVYSSVFSGYGLFVSVGPDSLKHFLAEPRETPDHSRNCTSGDGRVLASGVCAFAAAVSSSCASLMCLSPECLHRRPLASLGLSSGLARAALHDDLQLLLSGRTADSSDEFLCHFCKPQRVRTTQISSAV